MKEQVKAPILIAVSVLVVGFIVYMGVRMIGNAGNTDQGQIQYTPGKPPWEETDPNKKGPGGAPDSPVGAPIINNSGK